MVINFYFYLLRYDISCVSLYISECLLSIICFIHGKITVFRAEYFNNMKKCWESLLERVNLSGLYEYGPYRGHGVTLKSLSSIHLNISSALIKTISDLLTMILSTMTTIISINNMRGNLDMIYCNDSD